MKIGDKVRMTTSAGSRAIDNSARITSSRCCYKIPAILVAVGCALPTYPALNRPQNNAIVQICETKEIVFTHTDNLESIIAEIELRYFCNGEDVTDKISEQTKRNLRS